MRPVTGIEQISREVRAIEKVVIDANDRLRRRLRAALRIFLATSFLWLSALVSLGATVTSALAKTIGKDKTPRERRVLKTRHHYKAFKDRNATSFVGTASWYGHGFNNRKTASGKAFDKESMMAAHRSLPFGTMVRITNLKNQKTCIVEITDRGPYVHSRLIDVSEAAARALGFAEDGTTKVRIEVCNTDLADLHELPHPSNISDVLRSSTLGVGVAIPALK